MRENLRTLGAIVGIEQTCVHTRDSDTVVFLIDDTRIVLHVRHTMDS